MTTGVNGCLFLCAGAVTDSSVGKKAAGEKKIFFNIILFWNKYDVQMKLKKWRKIPNLTFISITGNRFSTWKFQLLDTFQSQNLSFFSLQRDGDGHWFCLFLCLIVCLFVCLLAVLCPQFSIYRFHILCDYRLNSTWFNCDENQVKVTPRYTNLSWIFYW